MTRRLLLGLTLVLCVAHMPAPAQSSERPSVLTVLRLQASSISKDVLASIESPVPSSMWLSVEEAPLAPVIEYAFLETFSDAGITLRVGDAGSGDSDHLMLLVLEQRAYFDTLGSGGYLRTVRTICEGRFSQAEASSDRYLGLFERIAQDTVAQLEPMPWTRPELDEAYRPGVFSKILTPIVIISGAALIVYLFFEVRSS